MNHPPGAPPRRPDQISTPPSGAVVPGGRASSFRGHVLIVWQTGQGMFVYDGTPAAGNTPVAFIVPSGLATDPYGNTLPAHAVAGAYVASFGNSPAAIFDEFGDLYWFDGTNIRSVVDIGANHGQYAWYDSSGYQVHYPVITIGSATGVGAFTVPAGIGLAGEPILVYSSGTPAAGKLKASMAPAAFTDFVSNPVPAGLFGALLTSLATAVHPGTSYTAETWQNISLSAGPAWAANTQARYALMPFGVTKGMVWVNAQLTSGTTVADGTIIGTVAAAYAPATLQGLDMATDNEPPNGGASQHLTVDTSGNIRCYGIPQANHQYWVNTAYPLD